ncbi:MAG: hypothetical protein HOE90_03810 [Bacteriovoracaceae bacterium]|nr:hypothetical protein [Bacteriovoracaceae bacterium]
MKKTIALLLIVFSTAVMAEGIIKIQVGKNYKGYTQDDLRRRIWNLERAVWQLQQKVFQLESKGSASDTWLCTVKAMSNIYTGTGGSKAVAKNNAIKNCKKGQGGDGFFCKRTNCEQ